MPVGLTPVRVIDEDPDSYSLEMDQSGLCAIFRLRRLSCTGSTNPMTIPDTAAPEPILIAVNSAVEAGKLTPASGQNLLRWLTEPYYAAYRQKLISLVQESRFSELNNLFWERIPFGTGGRRGPMSEFGSATINSRTIAESAHGLAVYVQRVAQPETLRSDSNFVLRAVVARDTRNRSLEFARLTASILAAHGFQVFFFPEPRATPELSFAVRYLKCHTGVMISASHNPPADNGFKAYWSTGGQILPPHDAGIIACVDACEQIPQVDFDAAVATGSIVLLAEGTPTPQVDQAYIDAVAAIRLSSARQVKALYSPLHGVGESSIARLLKQLGFEGMEVYEPQRVQDGNFPNVPDHLPNPERPQALQPAIEYAKAKGHALVMASDPDADRLAVAVRTGGGEFVCLTGNQLGALITDYVLAKRQAAGTLSPQHYVVETLVTTPMIAEIAESYGVRAIRDLLVGFKYIAAAVDANGPERFVFAAEESVGYLAGEYCRDKDASVAALFAMELASELEQKNQTLLDRLNELYVKHGFYHETQFVQSRPGAQGKDEISRMMLALREKTPGSLGEIQFDTAHDYQRHEVRSLPENTVKAPLLAPSGDLLILEGRTSNCRVTLAGRPSGTEPKIKFYLFANASTDLPLEEAKKAAQGCLANLEAALKQWLTSVVS